MQESTGTEMDGAARDAPDTSVMAAPDASVEVRSAQFQNLEAIAGHGRRDATRSSNC